jgi:hypothetical protein
MMTRRSRRVRRRTRRSPASNTPTAAAQGCPDFELAPLVAYDPKLLCANSEHASADAFVLALALAFNDMKGIQWLIIQLDKCTPETVQVSAENGQWHGMRIQTTRLTLLVLHELLKAIRTAQDNGICDDPCFTTTMGRLDPRYVADWRELLELANETPGDSDIRRYIEQVRHNFSAHYYQPKALAGGYRTFFLDRPVDQFNEHAFASFGRRVEATRFYFADAAVQMGQKLLDPSDALVAETRIWVLRMFQALRFLIEGYLRVKAEIADAQRNEG